MDGFTFVSKLKSLHIPNSENLKGSDFDWVFLSDEDKSLTLFWDWFFTNFISKDILKKEELSKYEELLSTGSILSQEHLNQIEKYLDNVNLNDDIPQLDFTSDDSLKKELELMERKLHRLNTKRNILSMQKMELEERIGKKHEDVQRLKYQLELVKRDVDKKCSTYSRTLEELSDNIQDTVAPFEDFETDQGSVNYFSQLSNEKWKEGEKSFKDSLFKYIYRQFQEGVEVIVGPADESTHLLLDVGDLDLQFVRGPRQAEYIRNAKELNRISAMLQQSEVSLVECELEKVQKNAEMTEALKILKSLHFWTKFSLPVLKENIAELHETKAALELDLEFQRGFVIDQATLVSKIERLRVISGNFELKLKRQDYFYKKQEIVYNFLLGQLARLDFVKIIYDLEKQKIKSLFDIILKVNAKMFYEHQESKQRIDSLNKLKDYCSKTKGTLRERETLQLLLTHSGDSDKNKEEEVTESGKEIVAKAKEIDSSQKNLEQEMELITETQMHQISKLFKSCAMLEDCLFGTSNSMNHLPETWIGCGIVDRQMKVEQTMGDLQKEMFDILKDYEKKKKMIQENPNLQKELLKWISVQR